MFIRQVVKISAVCRDLEETFEEERTCDRSVSGSVFVWQLSLGSVMTSNEKQFID